MSGIVQTPRANELTNIPLGTQLKPETYSAQWLRWMQADFVYRQVSNEVIEQHWHMRDQAQNN